eukprot:scaffold1637_cov410-Prasinococcus_capsulatus_cf.AAC.24
MPQLAASSPNEAAHAGCRRRRPSARPGARRGVEGLGAGAPTAVQDVPSPPSRAEVCAMRAGAPSRVAGSAALCASTTVTGAKGPTALEHVRRRCSWWQEHARPQ